MAQGTWEADKMLDVYIYDYLLKRNLQATAKSFMAEGKVATDPVAIDAPGGFLFEWWSVFWDIFIARTNGKHSEVASAYLEVQQMKTREQQQLQMQQLQLMNQRHQQIHRRDANHPAINGVINSINSDAILGSPTASVLAAKIYEERMKHPNSMDSEASSQLLDANRIALLKSAANPGQLVQGNSLNVSPLQLIQRNQQSTDIKNELGVQQRSLPMDASSLYGQGIMQGKSGLAGAGLNQGVSGPLKGWPLSTGIDPLRQNLGIQKPLISSQTQFQVFPQHQHQQQQQQLLAQAQAHNNLGISSNYGDSDPGRFRALARGSLSGKDGQPNGNDGSIGSPIQANSPKIRPDQAEYVMKVAQMRQSSYQQLQELQQRQQLQLNTRKRKPTSSGAANSTGTGNTVGPSPPSTPSTHTPGDGVPMAGNLQNMSIMPKTSMYTDGAGIASSSNQMADLEPFGDVGSFDENVESFLSNDDGDARDIFAALKRSPAEHNSESLKGFSFNEVDCFRPSNSKVVCCHFSSDGKLLASAGHEKKVFLWNMDARTRPVETKSDEHANIITDIRFRPNSTQLATSSFDGTVRLWNAAEQGGCFHIFTGHSSQVTSVDFHPNMTQILCSCDDNGEIRLWTIGQNAPTRISRGGRGKVRFQPRIGQLLAAAAENIVNLFTVETDMKTQSLKGHNNEVLSVCWDESGDYLASVSQDTVKVWSVAQGQCIHELSSNGNQFHSCVFHPKYPKFLVIGGYESLELWNIAENQRMPIHAHDGVIAALAQSPFTGFVASASHDRSVKIWK